MNLSLYNLTLVLSLFILFSCFDQDNDSNDDQIINIDDMGVTPLKYSDHFKEIKYIPLQLVSDLPFGFVHNAGSYGDFYYLLDISTTIRLFIFDSDGQQINSIGDRGNGEGKFYELIDFSIRPSTGKIYALDRTGKINVYGKSGDFLREIRITGPTNELYNGIEVLDNSIFLDINYPSISTKDKNYLLREISLDGAFKKDWLDMEIVNKGAGTSKYAMVSKSLHVTPTGVYYAKDFMDVIYHLEEDKVTPSRKIKSRELITVSEISNMDPGVSLYTQARNLNKVFAISNLVEGNGFRYFTYTKGAAPFSVVEKSGKFSLHQYWIDDISLPGQSFQAQPPPFFASSRDGQTAIGVVKNRQAWQDGIKALNQDNGELIKLVTSEFDKKIQNSDQPFLILYDLN